jgi:hypothetical protein
VEDHGVVEVWSVAGPALLATLGELVEPVVSAARSPLAFSPDNRLLAHGGVFGTAVRVWDLKSGELAHELWGLLTLPEEIVFDGLGQKLAANDGGTTCLWHLSPARVQLRPVEGELVLAAISPSGRHVALGVEGCEGAVIPIDSGPVRADEDRPDFAALPARACPVFRGDGQDLIAAAFGADDTVLAGIDRDGIVHVWDLQDAEELFHMDLALESKYRYDSDVAACFAPDGRLLAVVVDDYLSTYDWRNEDEVASGSVRGLAWPELRWTPDGRFVGLLLHDSAEALDVEEGELLEEDDALQATESAYGVAGDLALARAFVSLDQSGGRGVRRPDYYDDSVTVSALDGSAEVYWPAESPLLDVRFVGLGERLVAVTVAGVVAVLEPVGIGRAKSVPAPASYLPAAESACDESEDAVEPSPQVRQPDSYVFTFQQLEELIAERSAREPEEPHEAEDDALRVAEELGIDLTAPRVEPTAPPRGIAIPAPAPVAPPTLASLLTASGLKFREEGGAPVLRFSATRTERVELQVREFAGGLLGLYAALPPVRRHKDQAYRSLLEASFQASYAKAFRHDSGALVLAAEVPLAALSPESFTGLCTGLAALGDVNKDDLTAAGLKRPLYLCSLHLGQHLSLDQELETERLSAFLREAGLPIRERGPGHMTTRLTLLGQGLDCIVRVLPTCLSFILVLGGVRPQAEEKLGRLLTLNRSADVAKCGLNSDGDVALLYEVPALYEGLLDHLVSQFTPLLMGAVLSK